MSKPPKDACIVTVATAAHFLAGQQRLANSVKEWGDGVAMLNWQGFLPPGSPPHQAVPYAFKAYAIKAARDMGFKKDTLVRHLNVYDGRLGRLLGIAGGTG